MSSTTEREKQSFAETALRLGGKTEEEARRTGAVDKADEQVESAVRAAVPDRQQPHPQGRLGRQGAARAVPAAAAAGVRIPATPSMEQSLDVVRRRREAGTLYDDKGKVSRRHVRTSWARPATGACSSTRSTAARARRSPASPAS